jgi:hypothetical protein
MCNVGATFDSPTSTCSTCFPQLNAVVALSIARLLRLLIKRAVHATHAHAEPACRATTTSSSCTPAKLHVHMLFDEVPVLSLLEAPSPGIDLGSAFTPLPCSPVTTFQSRTKFVDNTNSKAWKLEGTQSRIPFAAELQGLYLSLEASLSRHVRTFL